MPTLNNPVWPETESCLHLLDSSHRQTFDNALNNVLSLTVAEQTFAQILDGLPLRKTAGSIPRDHLVVQLGHQTICDGFIDKARAMRRLLNTSELRFEPWLVMAFQQSVLGTKSFALRLIEMVVVGCHEIAVMLYQRDDGAHPHKLHRDWYVRVEEERESGTRPRGVRALPVAFSHRHFWCPELCPRGEADVAGYWAEGQIFGGVIVFDRGVSGRESKSIWLHGAQSAPSTLYPPTDDQLDSLIVLLLSGNSEGSNATHQSVDKTDVERQMLAAVSPLPIHGTAANRPRWDPWAAQTQFHIYRDKHALYIPPFRTLTCTSIQTGDWPEGNDRRVASDLLRQRSEGKVVDPEELNAALVGAWLVTPTSPYIHPKPDWYTNSIWRGA